MTKQTADKLMKAAAKMLDEASFVKTPDKWYDYTKNRAEKKWRRRGWNICIFAIFEDVDRAKELNIPCGHTGKYNQLYLESESNIQYAINQYD